MTADTTTWNFHRKCLFALGCAAFALACDRGSPDSESLQKAGISSVRKVSTTIHTKLVENSIGVTSVSQPGIAYGLNDSGNESLLFAFDSTGRGRGYWKIGGATNRDWEAAALAPCPGATSSCLFIGDVGDNSGNKTNVSIYLIEEPKALDSMPTAPVPMRVKDRLDFRYEDHPHDVEAMYVTADRSVFLISKRRLIDDAGKPRPALVFRLDPSAWDSSGTVTAPLVDSLPIVPGRGEGQQITDAALSANGRLLAVRTYADVFIFAVDSARGLPRKDVAPTTCAIKALKEKQGEGIGWWPDQHHLILTSERRNAPVYVIECRLPV